MKPFTARSDWPMPCRGRGQPGEPEEEVSEQEEIFGLLDITRWSADQQSVSGCNTGDS